MAQFGRAFDYFDITQMRTMSTVTTAPIGSRPAERIYLTYVRDLLRQGKAYLCFATKDELADISARQQAAKIPSGCSGTWAIWRDASPG